MESMTGFAELGKTIKNRSKVLELKAFARSWNNKFLELRINLPPSWKVLEKDINLLIRSHFSRGRIEITLEMGKNLSQDLLLNSNQLEKLLQESLNVAEKFLPTSTKAKTTTKKEIIANAFRWDPLNLFLLQEKLVSQQNSLHPELRKMLQIEAAKLVQTLKKNRLSEGKQIAKLLFSSLLIIEKEFKKMLRYHVKDKKTRAADLQKLLTKDAVLIAKRDLTKQEIEEIKTKSLLEAASSLEKSDLQEELDRLHMFTGRMKAEIKSGMINVSGESVSIGKSLDFISQEMIREINTIGSKTKNMEIRKSVLEIKNIVEQIREQARNIQ